jgi:hypothetical protein
MTAAESKNARWTNAHSTLNLPTTTAELRKRWEKEQDREASILADARQILASRGGDARAHALSAAKRSAIARKGGLAKAAAARMIRGS